jgi:hypothetical protein
MHVTRQVLHACYLNSVTESKLDTMYVFVCVCGCVCVYLQSTASFGRCIADAIFHAIYGFRLLLTAVLQAIHVKWKMLCVLKRF